MARNKDMIIHIYDNTDNVLHHYFKTLCGAKEGDLTCRNEAGEWKAYREPSCPACILIHLSEPHKAVCHF